MQNPRASDDSSSSDVEAEISDGLPPLDRSHRAVEDEGNVIKWVTCFFPSPPFLPQKFQSFFCVISFVGDESRDVSMLHEGASSSDKPRFGYSLHKLGRFRLLNQTALWSTFALPHERAVTTLGSS